MRKQILADVPPGLENPIDSAVSQRDRSVLDMVAEAVRSNQTRLAYQSVVVANDPSRIGFYEGLMRILDETGRVIPAKDFMPVIEKTELGREIDRLALRMGMRALAENPNVRISINMSARSIGYRPWRQTLGHWLKKVPSIGERLILEITESSAIDQPEITADFMDRLAAEGICFALDDFGAGFTSLRYMKDFYFDVLKIDAAFCDGIAGQPDDRAIVSSLVSMGHHFEMLIVGEGIECKDDAAVLAELGVDCLQGFLFDAPTTRPTWRRARPAPSEAVSAA